MTTRESKIQAITKAIQAAVPDVMKLQRGCYFSGDGYSYGMIVNMHSNSPFMFCATVARGEHEVRERVDFDKSLITIHGSNIGICEIMLWLDTVIQQSYFIRSNGDICEEYFDSYIEVTQYLFHTTYNLHKDTLDQQSDKLINLLFTFTQS